MALNHNLFQIQCVISSHLCSICFLQDLPDVQELIAEVNAEKYSLQAAAILGEDNF